MSPVNPAIGFFGAVFFVVFFSAAAEPPSGAFTATGGGSTAAGRAYRRAFAFDFIRPRPPQRRRQAARRNGSTGSVPCRSENRHEGISGVHTFRYRWSLK